MRLGGKIAGGPVWAQHFLHEGETYPEEVGNGALGAEVPLPSTQDLLTSINRVGSQVTKAQLISSYVQVKTALGMVQAPPLQNRGEGLDHLCVAVGEGVQAQVEQEIFDARPGGREMSSLPYLWYSMFVHAYPRGPLRRTI
jgi:hypothetical protein